MESPIKDLLDLVDQFQDVNVKKLLEDAYNRGFQEGYEITKEKIIQEIKNI